MKFTKIFGSKSTKNELFSVLKNENCVFTALKFKIWSFFVLTVIELVEKNIEKFLKVFFSNPNDKSISL